MTLRVRFDLAAFDEARAARNWYTTRVLGSADFVAEMWWTIEQVRWWPDLAPRLELEGVSAEVRRAPLRRFPFGVIDLVLDDTVWVVALAHARRRPGY